VFVAIASCAPFHATNVAQVERLRVQVVGTEIEAQTTGGRHPIHTGNNELRVRAEVTNLHTGALTVNLEGAYVRIPDGRIVRGHEVRNLLMVRESETVDVPPQSTRAVTFGFSGALSWRDYASLVIDWGEAFSLDGEALEVPSVTLAR
jgi:hypothetical protein